MTKLTDKVLNITVLVASLGYFVDIYDLQLFNMVSKASIMSTIGLNIKDEIEIARLDTVLFNWQMIGMLFGGILWGILGDIKGRKSILFGSIILYSLANVVNAFVTTELQYTIVRFLAGIGLAGELGAAITLVSEIMTKETRGYGTVLLVSLGALGAVVARFMGGVSISILGFENWQIAYIIGGILGFILLILRFATIESGMFESMKKTTVPRGNFLEFFLDTTRFRKYLWCVIVGLPIWYVLGIIIKHSDVFYKEINPSGGIMNRGDGIMYSYIGLCVGDLISGWLSQRFQSRKKLVRFYLFGIIACMLLFFFVPGISVYWTYFLCFAFGIFAGYWALFVTIASEHFGTNVRSTVTTTAPNFVRGAVFPMSFIYLYAASIIGNTYGAFFIGLIFVFIALYACNKLEETFGKNLDYLEKN